MISPFSQHIWIIPMISTIIVNGWAIVSLLKNTEVPPKPPSRRILGAYFGLIGLWGFYAVWAVLWYLYLLMTS